MDKNAKMCTAPQREIPPMRAFVGSIRTENPKP